MGATTDRWLPILALALIAASMAGFFLPAPEPIFLHHAFSVVAGALGAVALVRSIRPDPNPSSWTTAGFGAFTVLAVLTANIVQTYWKLGSLSAPGLTFLFVPATVLTTCGATLFWGAALARRDHPGHERLALIGRIGAGLSQLGFVFAFVQEVPSLRYVTGAGMPGMGAPAAVLTPLLRLAIRALLLWASVEMMRSGSDPELLRLRFTRVHRIMIAWLVLLALYAVPIFFQRVGRSQDIDAGAYLWRNLLYCLVIATTAFLLARRFRILPAAEA